LDHEFQLETFLTEAGALGVRVVGELDMATAGELTDAVAAWPERVDRCVVDLSNCSFLDSSGIRALLMCQRELDGGKGTMQLIGVAPHVERVLRIAGVHEVLEITHAHDPLGADGDRDRQRDRDADS
jgi:anti-anti-sigma factor